MKSYLQLIEKVLKEGVESNNRTGIPTLSVFGGQIEVDLDQGFPLLTTKSVNFHAIIVELLWFISGSTNIQFLVKNNTNIWNEWAYKRYIQSTNDTLLMPEFIERIKNDNNFAEKHGSLGPIYGKQWRNFNGIDQLTNVINLIKKDPDSRRMIVSAWNVSEISGMELPPCHCFFQFKVLDNKLHLHMYQRSGDLFLGVPFNIASYALLLSLVAQITGYKTGKFVHSFGDLHIYENHITQCKTMLIRECYDLPTLKLNSKITSINEFTIEDIQIIDYKHHPKLVGSVAV